MKSHLLALFLLLFSAFLSAQLRFEYDKSQQSASSEPKNFVALDGRLFFTAVDGYNDREVWCFEPEVNRSFRVSDLPNIIRQQWIGPLTVFNKEVFFSGFDGEQRRLWRIPNGANEATQMMLPDSLLNFDFLTPTEEYLYWVSKTANGWYLVQMDQADNLLQLLPLPSFATNLGQLGDDIYAFMTGSIGVRRFSPGTSQLDTVAANVMEIEGVYDFVRMGSANGKLVGLTRIWSTLRMFVYDPAVDTLFINEEVKLEGNNFRTPFLILKDRILVHVNIPNQGIRIREYLPETNEFVELPALTRWNDTYELFQELDGKLLLSGRVAPGLTLDRVLLYDLETDEITDGPDLGYSLDHNSPQPWGENQIVLLDGDWYFSGTMRREDIELYRYQPDTDQYGKISEIHQGTISSFFTSISPYLNGDLLVTDVRGAVRYNPATRQAVDLADDIPGLKWGFYSTAYSMPGFLGLGNVTYQDSFYRALVYDSVRQEMIPLLPDADVCVNIFGDYTGPFVFWDNAIWFAGCAQGDAGPSLFRYTPGAAAPERIPIQGRVMLSSLPGDKQILPFGDRLVFVTDTFNYASRFEMMSYHPDEGAARIASPLPASRSSLINRSDRIIYFQASAPRNKTISLAYQANGTIRPLVVGNDSLLISSPDAIAKVPGDEREYFVSDSGPGAGIYRYDPLMDTTGLLLLLAPEISNVSELLFHQERFYFSGRTLDFGLELYSYDLATQEVVRLADIRPGGADGRADNMLSIGDRVYFNGWGDYRGYELWSYGPDCFSLALSTSPSRINWPTGSVEVTIGEGTPPFSYQWSTGDTTAFLTNVAAGFYEVIVTDSQGCTGSRQTWVESNGIISNTTTTEAAIFTVYPNPFQEAINLELPPPFQDGAAYKIYAMNGQILLQGVLPAGQQASLNTLDLPTGMLVLVIVPKEGSGRLVRKIIKR